MKKFHILLFLLPLLSNAQVRIYPLDGNANEIINGQNGTLGTGSNSPIDTSDRFGNPHSAYYFDGGDIIDIPVSGLLNTSYSISAWVSSTSLPSFPGIQDFVAIGTYGSSDQAFGLDNDNLGVGYFHAGYSVGGPSYRVFEHILPQVNQWYHYTVTRSSSVARLYLDGTLIDTIETQGHAPDYGATPNATIGCRSIAGFQAWIGMIDDVRFYDHELSADEVISVSEIKNQDHEIFVYPNPATDQITIQTQFTNPTIFVLYNSQGQEILTEKIIANSNRISTNELANGIYNWKVMDGHAFIQTGKLVILK